MTARVRAEEELRGRRDYAEALLATVQDGLAVLGGDGRVVEVNRRFCELTGLGPDEAVGRRPSHRRWPRSELEAVRELHERARRTGSASGELMLRRRDGRRAPVLASLSRISDPAAGGRTLVGLRDMTGLRRAEAEERALRRVAIAVANDADADAVFALVAEEAARLFGADAALVVRFDDREAVVVGAWRSPDLPRVAPGTRVPLDRGALGQVRRTGRFGRLDLAAGDRPDEPLRSRAAAPVRTGNRIWGAVAVAARDAAQLPADAGERLDRFAALVALALADAETRTALAEHVAEQETLRRIATAVAAAGDEDVFGLIAAESGRLLGVEGTAVIRFDAGSAGGPRGTVVGGGSPSGSEGMPAPDSAIALDCPTATADVFRTGRSASRHGYQDADEATLRLLAHRGFSSGISSPIRVGGRLWGALSAATTRGRRLPSRDEGRLERVAELVGLAVSGAEARAELGDLATTDNLTGLRNQRAFEEHLEAEVSRARRYGRSLGLVLIDLDRFKAVNDRHGRQTGNAVLIEVARRLGEVARAGEILARIGGEELAWILPETDGPGAHSAAERARRAVGGTPFPDVGRMTISAGVCELGDAADEGDLFRRADAALYRAKADGLDRTVRYVAGAAPLPAPT